MWILIPYILVQIILWFVFNGDFSVLAKSSDAFVFFSTLRGFVDLSDVDYVVRHLENYVVKNLYWKFKKRYARRLDNVYLRLMEISILVMASIIFQFL